MPPNKPPVESDDIVLLDCNAQKGSTDAAWVPASEVGRLQKKLEACQARVREFAARLKAVGAALYGGNARHDDFDSKFPN